MKGSPALNKIFIMLAMSACYAMIFLDMSGVAVILPQMQQHLNLSNNLIHWAVNSFILSMAVLLLLGGKLVDYLGLRKVFILGNIIFIIASVICACAVDGGVIIAGRILQGVGASLIMPASAVLIHNNFPNNEYGKAFGTILLFSNFFYAIGPFLGGVLAQYLSWRGVFWINLPIGIVCLYCTFKAVKKDGVIIKPPSFDVTGLIIFMTTITAFVVALMQGEEVGWTNPFILGLLIYSLIGLMLFIYVELKSALPLLEIRLFQNKIFMSGNIIVCTGYTCFAAVIFFPLWLHNAFGYSPTLLGLALLPATIPTIFLPRFAGVWRDQSGPRQPMVVGVCLTVFSLFWLAFTAHMQNYWLTLIGLVTYGFGLPLFIPTCITTIMSSISPEQRGVAAGVFSTFRQVALALGFAVISAVIAASSFTYAMLAMSIFALIAAIFIFIYIPKNKPDDRVPMNE